MRIFSLIISLALVSCQQQISSGAAFSCYVGNGFDLKTRCFGPTVPLALRSPSFDETFVDISVKGPVICGIRQDQTVSCYGQVSILTKDGAPDPNDQFLQISHGYLHGCGLLTNHTVTCWGSNSHNQTAVPAETSFNSVASGFRTSCAIRKNDSAIVCWGDDTFGKVSQRPLGGFSQVTLGIADFACAIRLDGKIICWGDNRKGQTISPGGSFVQLSSGRDHSCALQSDQTLSCWGLNINGQATAPAGLFVQISAGDSHSCAIRTDTTIQCWGISTLVLPSPSFSTVSIANNQAACAMTNTHVISCWGTNVNNWGYPSSIRFKSITSSLTATCGIVYDTHAIQCWAVNPFLGGVNPNPILNIPLGSFLHIGRGMSSSLCALRTDQSIACWGTNYTGEIFPPSGNEFVQVDGGAFFHCGLRKNGSLICWGSGLTLYPFPLALNASSFSSGSGFVCALHASNSTMDCWGNNANSQISNKPLGIFKQISLGCTHGCALRFNGSIVCWGSNSNGELSVPTGNYSFLSVGCNINCAISYPDGNIVCWGFSIPPFYSTMTPSVGFLAPPLFYRQGAQIKPCDGFFSSSRGSSTYMCAGPCIAGSYGTGPTNTCSGDCPVGFYCPPSTSTPYPCPVGTYSPLAGLFSNKGCFPCALGQYSNISAAINCNDCTSGSFSSLLGSSTCVACSPGRAQPNDKAFICSQCPAGKYTDTLGAVACISCQPGFQQPLEGADFMCEICPPRTFTNNIGTATCTPCSDGVVGVNKTTCELTSFCLEGYAPNFASGECIACPRGTYGPPKTLQCLDCPSNTYTSENATSECQLCDQDGMTCIRGEAVISAGYWPYEINGHIKTAVCPIGLCQGSKCGANRDEATDNILCARCNPGYSEWNGECIQCDHASPLGICFAIFMSFVYVWAILVSAQQSNNMTSILLYFLQTATVMVGSSRAWLDWINFFNISPQSATQGVCFAPMDAFQRLQMALFLPWILFVELGVIYCVHRCLRSLSCNGSSYARASMALVLFTYMHVSSTVLKYLQCVQVGDSRVVFSSPSISCHDDRYNKWMIWVIFFLVIDVMGMPCVLLYMLAKHWESLNSGKIISRWGILYESNKRQHPWWTVIILWRRLLYVVIDIVVHVGSLRNMLFAFLSCIVLASHMYIRPYEAEDQNDKETYFITIHIVLSILLTANPAPYSLLICVFIFILIVCPAVIFVVTQIMAKYKQQKNTPTTNVEMSSVVINSK